MARPVSKVQADISLKTKELQTLSDQIAELRGQMTAVENDMVRQRKQILDSTAQAYLALLDQDDKMTLSEWSDQAWSDFEGYNGDDAIKGIRIAKFIEKSILSDEISINPAYVVPLFEATGPIIIKHNSETAELARSVLQNFLIRSAVCLPNKTRFTLLDPLGMGAAYPFAGFLGRRVRPSGRSTGDELADVQDDIRRINERVIGQAERFAELSLEQQAGESFEIVAAAGFPRAYARDPRAVESLQRIATAGPRAGRHLIVEWNVDEDLPHDFPDDAFGQNATLVDCRNDNIGADPIPDGSRQKVMIADAGNQSQSRSVGTWQSTIRPDNFQSSDSSLRVETPIGERLNFWLGEQDDGKPSAHAMIAGQTGSGKSSLLHVIITGLTSRYSPDQLALTLIDGKQGVEFETYRALPHADVVCLRSTPALARSVVADFADEMDRRFEVFQNNGVVKLGEYRKKTGAVLPRRLLIVDEYQQILEGAPEEGAELLGRLLEKGRAAGMHLVLGSQTFEQRGLPSSALTHIHTWASLSLQPAYIQSLQVFGSEGKRLIRDLAVSGEVVLNDEGGRDGANTRGAVARLIDVDGTPLLTQTVDEIQSVSTGSEPPIILSGREGAVLSENPFCVRWKEAPPSSDEIQKTARLPTRQGGFGVDSWLSAEKPIPLWLGRRFDVRGHALCTLRRAPSNNLLVFSAFADIRNRMLASSLTALGTMLHPEDLRICMIDGLRPELPGGQMVATALDLLEPRGFKIDRAIPQDCADLLSGLAALATEDVPQNQSVLLIISEPEYQVHLQGSTDIFAPKTEGPIQDLRTILSRGPQNGLHTIVTASGLASFGQILSASRETNLFNHRVVQQMNEDDSMTLFASLQAARVKSIADHPYATLLVDQLLGIRNATIFNAYTANSVLNNDQDLTALKQELSGVLS